MSQAVLVEVVRNGFVEGHHYGSAVALAPDGTATYAAGDVAAQVLPRSCNKPLQAVGMLRAGLELDHELLALASASHSGEPFHVEGVHRILERAGLGVDDLQTPLDYPLDDDAREAVIRGGGQKASVLMNCSGKHAAMLATCVANGWDTATYRDPQHPLQQAIAATFTDLTGEEVEVVAVDGCGAPLLSTSLTGLARAFARLATATAGPEHLVAQAIRQHPEYVSGNRRDERRLLAALPGAIGKAGAESCYVVAMPDGRAFALKHDDGGARARPVTMAALLEQAALADDAVRATGEVLVLGAGMPVGELRAVLPASTASAT